MIFKQSYIFHIECSGWLPKCFYMVAEVFKVFLGYCCAIAFFPYNTLDLGVLYGHTYTPRASACNF